LPEFAAIGLPLWRPKGKKRARHGSREKADAIAMRVTIRPISATDHEVHGLRAFSPKRESRGFRPPLLQPHRVALFAWSISVSAMT